MYLCKNSFSCQFRGWLSLKDFYEMKTVVTSKLSIRHKWSNISDNFEKNSISLSYLFFNSSFLGAFSSETWGNRSLFSINPKERTFRNWKGFVVKLHSEDILMSRMLWNLFLINCWRRLALNVNFAYSFILSDL